MLTADVLDVEKLRADDLDFVAEGPGRFDPPVVSLLRCQNCNRFSTTRYCLPCRISMER